MIRRFIFLVASIVVLIQFVSTGSIGISPAKFTYYFEPNLEEEINFKVINIDPERELFSYVRGDLADYVNLSKTSFIGGGGFVAHLKLPGNISIPGKHKILIGVIEEEDFDGSGIGGISAVQAVIEIIVPYPGKYLEADFTIKDINEGENIYFRLDIHNLGTDDVLLSSKLEIYGSEKEKIMTKDLVPQNIKSKEKVSIEDFIDGSNLRPGFYPVILTLDYGEKLKINDSFRVGHFFSNITDYSYRFKSGKINPFNVEVENLWNLKMENVYSKVTVTDMGKIIDEFKTPSINLEPWEKINLTGFFDATEIVSGRYVANIRLFYVNESSFKLVAIYVEKQKLDKIWLIVGGISFLIILIMSIIFIHLMIKIKRLNKNVKKSKK
tara:strand:- start:632 stop:1777 length:1146 start_codon:yes stop_codon:yes gene_type:complete